jgi:hypothetical protein
MGDVAVGDAAAGDADDEPADGASAPITLPTVDVTALTADLIAPPMSASQEFACASLRCAQVALLTGQDGCCTATALCCTVRRLLRLTRCIDCWRRRWSRWRWRLLLDCLVLSCIVCTEHAANKTADCIGD